MKNAQKRIRPAIMAAMKELNMGLYVVNYSLGEVATDRPDLLRLHIERSLIHEEGLWLDPPETFHEYARYFGMNVERIRRETKMTREFLASLACMSRSTLARFERGKGDPRLSSMCYLSQALETTIGDLLSAPPRAEVDQKRTS